MEKRQFTVEGKRATLYAAGNAGKPLIVLNNYSGDGSSVLKGMEEVGTPECNLLVVGELKWDHDMTPWYCPPLSPQDTPCTGGADEYLHLLLSEILPKAKELIHGEPPFIGIAGYSLAGLFAVYAMYQCDTFDGVASMSGSLWFPKIKEFIMKHDIRKRPNRMYFSLGDREAHTRNNYLKTVQENTEAIVQHYKDIGLDVTWELNPGNHFKDAAIRSAKGIKALLAE